MLLCSQLQGDAGDTNVANSVVQKVELHSYAFGTETRKVSPKSTLILSAKEYSLSLQQVNVTLFTSLIWLNSGTRFA